MKYLRALLVVGLFAVPTSSVSAVSLNSTGHVAQGVGGGIAAVDDRAIAQPAGGTVFVNDDTVIYQLCDGQGQGGCHLETYQLSTGTKRTVSPKGANFLSAGGGRWAAWLGGNGGLYTSSGSSFPDAGLGPMGPDGSLAIKVSYQSAGPWDVLEADGSRWRLTDGDASDVQLLGQGRAVWHEGSVLKVRGVPQPVTLPGTIWWPRTVFVNGAPWMLYQSDVAGGRLVLHPYDSLKGYAITDGGNSYRPDAIVLNGKIRVAYGTVESEAPGEVRVVDVDPASARIDLTSLIPTAAAPAPPAPAPVPVPIVTRPPGAPAPVAPPGPAPTFAWGNLAIIGGAPDVRSWSETTAITRVTFSSAGLVLDFDAKDRWPDVTPPGWDGPLQYTIWFAQVIDGRWTATGVIQCWRGLEAAGGDVTAPTQFGQNWVYFAAPLHQPAAGETIGFFVTAGNQRMTDLHAVAERSDFVAMPFPGSAGGTFTFPGAAAPAPPFVPAPVPVPAAQPDPRDARIAQLQGELQAASDHVAADAAQQQALQVQIDQLTQQLAAVTADRDALKARPTPSCTAKVPSYLKSLGIKIGCQVQQ